MFESINVRKSLLTILKILVFILFVLVLYNQLKKITLEEINAIELTNGSYLFFACILVFVNWSFELFKWILTTRKLTKEESYKKSTFSLFAGITTGIVTPNRIGNFIGRILYYKGKYRGMLILGTLYGNLAQFVATILFGLIGIMYFDTRLGQINYNEEIYFGVYFVCCFLILTYFVYPFVPIEKIKFFRRYANLIARFRKDAKSLATPLLLISLLRYITFVLQFMFVLSAFGAEFSHQLMYGIFLVYFVTTLIPNLIMGKLVVRESIALLILGIFIENSAIILVSSLTVWIINLGIPALIGFYFLLKNKKVGND